MFVHMFLNRHISDDKIVLLDNVDQMMTVSICFNMKIETICNLGIHVTLDDEHCMWRNIFNCIAEFNVEVNNVFFR